MELTVEQTLRQALALHKAGKLEESAELYKVILKTQPQHPDANHNLGVIIAFSQGVEESLPFFREALRANPETEHFWLSYIDALIKAKQFDLAEQTLSDGNKSGVQEEKLDIFRGQLMHAAQNNEPSQLQINNLLENYQTGRLDYAEELALSITKEFPKYQFAWKVLGAILKKGGRKFEAVNANQTAVMLSPQDTEALYNLGTTLKEIGELENAEINFRKAITLRPDLAEAHNNLGATLQELGKLEEAEVCYRYAIKLNYDYDQAHYNLGTILKELFRFEEAEVSFRHAIELKPNFPEAHNGLGFSLLEQGRLDQAETCYRRAIALRTDYAEAHDNLGAILKILGRLDEAEVAYERAITLKTDFAEAHRHLTLMKTFQSRDEQFSKMRELYLDENISEEKRCHINFALAKACEDLGDFEQAFKYYHEGNLLRKKALKYSIDKDVQLFSQLKSSYPKIYEHALKREGARDNLAPIFIVGMPRSGTTLAEQIISSHSEVTGAGELFFATQFGASIAQGLTPVTDNTLPSFRQKYLAELMNVSDKNKIVTDKMPHNFCYIGLILAALPEAKIVHVKRNPAAVCWANYKQFFLSETLGYCYDLNDIVNYYGLYEDIMRFWRKTLTNGIYNLDYDLLTINQENETRKLIDHLELSWDEKCLTPHNNTRSVATASNMQIREKVYQGSSEQWKKYKPYLNGVLDNLDSSI